jgi:hypothetical protein
LLGLTTACGSPTGQTPKLDSGELPNSEQPGLEQTGSGQLEVRANGEDFVRDGFTSKDGWAIAFDHVYVTLADVTALQTDPPFEPDSGSDFKVLNQVQQEPAQVIDLAVDDGLPLVAQFPETQAGRYNALNISLVPAESGPAPGQSLSLVGQATKADQTVAFTLDWDATYRYRCGDFIGDQRKGILKAGDRAEMEATFHFDHVFGDGESPATDEINLTALGFEPLAALAKDNQVKLDRGQLQAQLSAENFQLLDKAMSGLVHTGEGHCEEVKS